MFYNSRNKLLVFLTILYCFVVNVVIEAQTSLNTVKHFITESNKDFSNFPIVDDQGQVSAIYYDQNDFKGVVWSIKNLQNDIKAVFGLTPKLENKPTGSTPQIIIGTLGKNKVIDWLVSEKLINARDIKDKWESFVITTIPKSKSKFKNNILVIAGSDKRGTIYGVYELSRQLGVSPWYWWADVPILKRKSGYVISGYYASGEPKVKYRGIFINDENPSMQRWARAKFGGMNTKMYVHVYDLLLRLKANYLWPGMWGAFTDFNPGVPLLKHSDGSYVGNSFNEDDPENPSLANEYGIVIGTSHHEPMQRSQQEWIRNKNKYGNGEWNYVTNEAGLKQFFREGMEHTKNFESLITMGMRGDDDKPMVDAGSAQANFKVLEKVFKDQRDIIEDITGRPASKTPQVWTLYSEVLDYYDQGLKVPDDMIIMLCNDNWGNVRRLPDLKAKNHPGGYGMYYHVAYYGAPRASKWLNTSSISKMWEQLQLTYDYGVDKIWILNVGDIKPCEYTMDFFLNMAWNPHLFTKESLSAYSLGFCEQQFGNVESVEAADILNTYCKFASRVTPEMLDENTYNLQSGEFKMVRDEFLALEARALRQYLTLEQRYKDVYNQLILFPVQAMANLYDMYYSLALNIKFANEMDANTNLWAEKVEKCFKRDSLLCANYNLNISGGKWNHMMDQVHIGYSSWHPPVSNILPKVRRIQVDDVKQGMYIFSSKNNVVVMEAEHFFECKSSKNTIWTIIPDMGRTLSGLALFPYTQVVDGSYVAYKMKLRPDINEVKVRLILNSTMPFIRGGHQIQVQFIGGETKEIDINSDLVWGNHYTKMYPTGAARINERELTLSLPKSNDGVYTLKISPLDPGILFYKIIVDSGGFENSHLKMSESEYVRW